jgi:hypothetical protein
MRATRNGTWRSPVVIDVVDPDHSTLCIVPSSSVEPVAVAFPEEFAFVVSEPDVLTVAVWELGPNEPSSSIVAVGFD